MSALPARRHRGADEGPMATWIFEPGRTEAEFRARHMMVTWVGGLFKDIHGSLELNLDRPLEAAFEGVIDAAGIWTGQPERDARLRTADFLDVEKHPRSCSRDASSSAPATPASRGPSS